MPHKIYMLMLCLVILVSCGTSQSAAPHVTPQTAPASCDCGAKADKIPAMIAAPIPTVTSAVVFAHRHSCISAMDEATDMP